MADARVDEGWRLEIVDHDLFNQRIERISSLNEARERIEQLIDNPDVWRARVTSPKRPYRVIYYYFSSEQFIHDFDRRKHPAHYPSTEELTITPC